jgi:hypothetical protein
MREKTTVIVNSPSALQRENAENLKQKFTEKEYRGLSPNIHIHVSVSELYSHDGSACSAGGNM